jgi:hypothetical protein
MTHHQIMIFPGEPTMEMQFGGIKITIGTTFLHFLVGRIVRNEIGTTVPYQVDLDKFLEALDDIRELMLEESCKTSDKQEELCRQRYQQRGVGYWSSWMDEPNPFENTDS